MRIGFIGVGAIAQACIEGLLTGPHAQTLEVQVSPRSRERVTQLDARFAQVNVAESNQAVVDHSDILFLSVLPNQMTELCAELNFRADQIVCSLVAGVWPSLLKGMIAPASVGCQLIPLPVIALHVGPVVLSPDVPEVRSLFNGCGDLVVLENEQDIPTLASASAVMSSYFALLNSVMDWTTSKGVDPERARGYLTSLFEALALEAKGVPIDHMAGMPEEHETPGGLNEYVRLSLKNAGFFSEMQRALEALYDGSFRPDGS